MEKDLIVKKLAAMAGECCNGYTEITDLNKDLMAKPAPIPPYDMAALFLDIEDVTQ